MCGCVCVRERPEQRKEKREKRKEKREKEKGKKEKRKGKREKRKGERETKEGQPLNASEQTAEGCTCPHTSAASSRRPAGYLPAPRSGMAPEEAPLHPPETSQGEEESLAELASGWQPPSPPTAAGSHLILVPTEVRAPVAQKGT